MNMTRHADFWLVIGQTISSTHMTFHFAGMFIYIRHEFLYTTESFNGTMQLTAGHSNVVSLKLSNNHFLDLSNQAVQHFCYR
eukprot:1716673-Ditylum_brightwellii.AAC.1